MVVKFYSLIRLIALLLFFFLIPAKTIAQCAGNDANIEICGIDLPNASNQAVDLYSLLGSNAIPGGVWTDNNHLEGLNPATGILNAQMIVNSGIYTYTYTVPNGSCVDNSATVTVVIGGYAGVTGPNATVCSDYGTYSLFYIFNGSHLSPHFNGNWAQIINGTPVPVSSAIEVEDLGIGTFEFTYTLPAIGGCPPSAQTAFLSVFRVPKPGKPAKKLLLCDDTDFSVYSNFDLNTRLEGADPGGTWSDNNGTLQITSSDDHYVDIKNIFDKKGIGEYSFTYSVVPSPRNPYCQIQTSTVSIKIEHLLDFTGAALVVNSDICEPEIPTATYSATLTKGPADIPNGQYNVTYEISDAKIPNSPKIIINEVLSFNNGVLFFPLDSKYFQQVGDFKIEIKKITDINSEGACNNIINNLFDILHVYPTPVLNGAKLTIAPACQNKSASVQITDALLLADGTYDIVYNLSGVNTSTPQTVRITVSGGVSNFTIPSNFIVNAGNTVVRITRITNVATTCTNTANLSGTLVVNPLPSAANLKIVVNDYCFNTPVTAALSGLGTLSNIEITYALSGNNTATQTILLAVSGGNVSFPIPLNLLTNTGSTAIAITNLVNTDTTCDILVNSVTDGFSIIAIPVAPTATSQQSFCKTDLAKIADLSPSGAQYQWFDSATSTTPLAASALLISGNYYVREVTPTNSCLSASTMVTVTINDLPAPALNQDGQNFCGINNPKVSDLSANTNAQTSIVWYDAAANGNVLSGTDLLQDNKTYYGFDFSNATGCFSENHVAVTVSLTDCSTVSYDFFIPDGFSPNGDGINETFKIPEIEFLYPDYTFEIYNRYGNIMFKGNKSKPDWDGRNSESAGINDAIVPNGVYFYIVNFNKDNKSPQQGRLYLNR